MLARSKTLTWANEPSGFAEGIIGFVYKIIETDTGMIYFGIKQVQKRIRRKPLKGTKRVRICYVESDWRTYNTSSPIMQEKLSKHPENYRKIIMRCCTSKTELKAFEAYCQLEYYIAGDWDKLYNEVINLRLRIR